MCMSPIHTQTGVRRKEKKQRKGRGKGRWDARQHCTGKKKEERNHIQSRIHRIHLSFFLSLLLFLLSPPSLSLLPHSFCGALSPSFLASLSSSFLLSQQSHPSSVPFSYSFALSLSLPPHIHSPPAPQVQMSSSDPGLASVHADNLAPTSKTSPHSIPLPRGKSPGAVLLP